MNFNRTFPNPERTIPSVKPAALATLLLCAAFPLAPPPMFASDGIANGRNEFLAVLQEKCGACHEEDESPELHGNINLSTLHGDRDWVEPERPDDSTLYSVVARDASDRGRMPRSRGRQGDPDYLAPLTPEERDLFRRFVNGEFLRDSIAPPEPARPPETDLTQTPTTRPPYSGEPRVEPRIAPPAPPFPTPSAPNQTPAPPTPNPESPTSPTPPPTPAVARTPPALTPASPPASAPSAPKRRTVISLEQVLDTIVADLDSRPGDSRKFLRYLSLTNLHNSRNDDGSFSESPEMLGRYRAAVAKLINSLSTNARIAIPEAVGEEKAILRLDLRDYDLSAEVWDRVIGAYPYGILGVDDGKERRIFKATGAQLPYLRADWFVFAAAQPPLYFDLLGIPDTANDLENILGIDLASNLQAGRAVRAGFRQSGVSVADRVIERHETGRHPGSLWTGYEFAGADARSGRDVFRAPLGPSGAGLTDNPSLEFRHDARTILFSLPNGLNAFMIAARDGSRLNRAPSGLLHDRKRPDSPLIAGISCFSCHDQGTQTRPGADFAAFNDEVGPVVLQTDPDAPEKRRIEELYAKPGQLGTLLREDRRKYLAALARATPGHEGQPDTIQFLYNRFKKDISPGQFAAEVGENLDDLLKTLRDAGDPDARLIAAQLKSGLPFSRRFFSEPFPLAVEALGYRLHPHHPIAHEEFRFEGFPVTTASDDSPPATAVPSAPTPAPSPAPSQPGEISRPAADTQHSSRDDRIVLSTDKTHYHDGDLLTVRVKVRENSFLRLYHQSVSGEIRQIFPNEFQRENFLPAGRVISIPDVDDSFNFRLRPPYGEELIVAVASPVQFSDYEEGESYVAPKGFRIGDIYRRGTRGLTVEAANRERPASLSTATAVYSLSE